MQVDAESLDLIFGRWVSQNARLRVTFYNSWALFNAACRLASGNGARGLMLTGDGWDLTISLDGAKVLFRDPREAPERIRDMSQATYDHLIHIMFATGGSCVITELRDPDAG